MDTQKVFEALPHVNEIWVTKDGNFHLHPHNGGEKITRESTEVKILTAKEVIALIDLATTKEEVITALGEDTRKTVKDAADKKIASLEV